SSLRFAVEYCKRFGKERIFYVAPFMSILEQNSDVIKEIVGEDNLLEHYSDFAQTIDNSEELNEYELRTDKWDSPVISTTLVQFLNSIFSNKTASVRRFHRLANSVIIIDEVQAIPIKCVNLFNLAMNFISRICGTVVVLCTATQPCFDNTEYPIELDEISEMNPDFKEDLIHFHRTELISACRVEQYTYEEAVDFCAEKFDENGNILVVVNTKKSAAAIYSLLCEKYQNTGAEIIHLSTGMCPQHRRDAINNIKKKLEDDMPTNLRYNTAD
ncbi:MAG: CRISPR-associated helicase/endonuclease Cas3, partial [Oscillospiraceae bacterium]|nr:CRISPR-associated helicase/endonuclease Cas3 [Oscillospiraceae bacterium]